MAYVEENGFETPVLLSELVTVLPAGHQPKQKGAKLMFDQAAFDAGRAPAPSKEVPSKEIVIPKEEEKPLPVEETPHGEKLNISLAFEPADTKNLSATRFAAVLVNDSNYFLDFTFLRRADGERGWHVLFRGTVAPNELIDLASLTHENLGEIERVALQAVAYKNDREFTIKPPVSATRRLDLTKFHKLHCFRPGIYFETPVMEIPLVKDDMPVEKRDEVRVPWSEAKGSKSDAELLGEKFRVDTPRKPKAKKDADNPHKLLPPIEVDLHIAELTDSLAGLEPADMLEMQLAEVRKTMKAHSRRIGQKIIFIHGKGEGVLRKAVLALLKKEYPKSELQDASFQEYGFGATLVTIH